MVIDKSKYSGKVNAFFTGFGNDRRIYLYDTLLKDFTRDEILSITAHELCHYKEEHVVIGIIAGSFGLSLGAILLNYLCVLIFGSGLKEMIPSGGVPGLILLVIIIQFAARPAANIPSRIMEVRADRFELAAVGNPEAVISMNKRLARTNKSPVLPHPFYVFYNSTHPAMLERIKMAEDFIKDRDCRKPVK
jgi:STE24 endopeptidase